MYFILFFFNILQLFKLPLFKKNRALHEDVSKDIFLNTFSSRSKISTTILGFRLHRVLAAEYIIELFRRALLSSLCEHYGLLFYSAASTHCCLAFEDSMEGILLKNNALFGSTEVPLDYRPVLLFPAHTSTQSSAAAIIVLSPYEHAENRCTSG